MLTTLMANNQKFHVLSDNLLASVITKLTAALTSVG
jgi:hypothetical protein